MMSALWPSNSSGVPIPRVVAPNILREIRVCRVLEPLLIAVRTGLRSAALCNAAPVNSASLVV